MIQKRNLLILMVAALFLIAGFYFVYFAYTNHTNVPEAKAPPEDKSLQETLVTSNENFALADNFYTTGDYANALREYGKALEATDLTQDQQTLIKYRLALSHRYNGEPFAALPLFKEVAADNKNNNIIQAYSVQGMGLLFYATADPQITQEIFKDGVYRDLYVPENIALSYRNLFEYGSSFYPLGMMQIRIANWYADEILRLQAANSGNQAANATIENYKGTIKKNIASTDADIARVTGDPYSGGNYIPDMTTRKAHVVGKLYRAGDASYGDPEQLFEEAMRKAAGSPTNEASAKYHYALYLAGQYGETRSNDIQKLLNDFYNTNRYQKTPLVRAITNEKDNVIGIRDEIALVARYDLGFRNFLISLGWPNESQ